MEGQFEYSVEYTITCSVLFENSIFGKMFKGHPGVSKMVLVGQDVFRITHYIVHTLGFLLASYSKQLHHKFHSIKLLVKETTHVNIYQYTFPVTSFKEYFFPPKTSHLKDKKHDKCKNLSYHSMILYHQIDPFNNHGTTVKLIAANISAMYY